MSERKKMIKKEAYDRRMGSDSSQWFLEGAQWADSNPQLAATGPSGDDERDADTFTAERLQFITSFSERQLFGSVHRSSFLAGRKGMVPAGEVEKLKAELDHHRREHGADLIRTCIEVVKAERERHILEVKRLEELAKVQTEMLASADLMTPKTYILNSVGE